MAKVFLKGTQSYLEFFARKNILTLSSHYLPKNMVFLGSLGSIVNLHAIIIYRVLRIGTISRSYFAKLFCYGYGSAIFIFTSQLICQYGFRFTCP